MATLCEVCRQQPFKYKCPACKIPTCSLPCTKEHKNRCIPTSDTALTAPNDKAVSSDTTPLSLPLLSSRPPLDECFKDLSTSAEYQALLTRYPSLKTKLARIFDATLEPPQVMDLSRHFRGGHRGNTYRKPWTQQRADEKALRIINTARESENEADDEDLREFFRLVQLKCSSEA